MDTSSPLRRLGTCAAIQHDFAARMRWSTTADYAQANHPPEVLHPTKLRVTSGESVQLDANPSFLIAAVRDNGTPALTRYGLIILTALPHPG